jgi:hypothetical protein
MRKQILACGLAMTMLLGGCSKSSDSSSSAAMIAYQGYYNAIEDNEKFVGSSLYYTISCEMSELPDGTHRYYIFLDEAQVAMYDVVMIAVENDVPYDQAAKMMPSVGILDSTEYTLIPYQSYTDGGYVKGLVLSGECTDASISLKVLVEWKDKNLEKTTREFLSFDLTMDGATHPESTASPQASASPSAEASNG